MGLNVLLSGLLVVIGFITAGIIAWQSWETKKAAQAANTNAIAAKASVEALISSERARIVAELQPCAFRSGTTWFGEDGAWLDSADILAGKHSIYKLSVTNLGKTPAEMFSYEVKLGALIEHTPPNPDSLPKTVTNLNDFVSGGATRVLRRINAWEAFGTTLVDKQKGIICITIKYGDVISDRSAETWKEHTTEIFYLYDFWSEFPLQQITAKTKYT